MQNYGSEILRPQSWPEYPTPLALPISYVSDTGTQTDNIACKVPCPERLWLGPNHEAEINSQVKNELIIRQKQLLDYNNKPFVRFMQDLAREHEERIMANKQLRHEINKMKAQVQKVEKVLASMKAP